MCTDLLMYPGNPATYMYVHQYIKISSSVLLRWFQSLTTMTSFKITSCMTVKCDHSSILIILNFPIITRKSSKNTQNLQERQPLRDLLRGLSHLELHADRGIQAPLGTHGLPENVAIMYYTHIFPSLFHTRLETDNNSGSSGGGYKIKIIIRKTHPIHFKSF